MSGFIDCCGTTDIGRRRPSNEDQFLIADVCKSMRVHQTSLTLDHQTRLFGETQGTLLLVADGMGGHEAGERASQLAIDGLVEYVLNRLSWFMSANSDSEHDFEEQLKRALLSCQQKIVREIAAIPQRRGMGSTLTMAYVVWPKMFLVHVGDSRCYLLRNGHLHLLTRDHTLATLTRESKGNGTASTGSVEVDEATVEKHPFSHVLWNVLGGDGEQPHPDATAVELAMGDVVLLCTDGLTNHVSHRTLREMLGRQETTASTCQRLVEKANAEGGDDNITTIVCRFIEKQPLRPLQEEIELPLENNVSDTVDYDEQPKRADEEPQKAALV